MSLKIMKERLNVLQSLSALTTDQADELKELAADVLTRLDSLEVDLTLPGPTAVDTGIAVAAPVLTVETLASIHETHRAILKAAGDKRRVIIRGALVAIGTASATALSGGTLTGPAVAGLVLTALRTIMAAKQA